MKYCEFLNCLWEEIYKNELNFKRKNNIFTIEYETHYACVEIQKSNLSNGVYVNAGIVLKEYYDKKKSMASCMHIFERLSCAKKGLKKLCFLDLDSASNRQVKYVERSIYKYVKENFESSEGFRQFVIKNPYVGKNIPNFDSLNSNEKA